MANQNFNLSAKRGRFYLRSSEPKDGYEKISYGDGKTTYHKYFNSVSGIITRAHIREVDANGKKLQFFEVTLKDGDTYNNVSVPLKNSKGNITDETKAFVSSLDKCAPFSRVNISANNKVVEKDGKSYDNLSVFINLLDEINPETNKPKSTGFIPFSEIPRAIKEDDADLGVTYDWRPVNKFYMAKIKEISAKFEDAKSKTEESTNHISESTTILADDLPF
jgi:hypothetical protein